jgi:hypothetical protein
MLAPDLPLANVNPFIRRKHALVLRIQITGDNALRPVPAANHLRDHLQRGVNGFSIVLARVVWERSIHRG